MATDAPMATATDLDLLTLAQWLSPAYPVGAFAYSHGLERLVHSGAVHDAASLRDWLRDVLEHGAGWSDALFLIAAWQAESRAAVTDIDDMARAFAGPAERRCETTQQGAAFCSVTAAVWDVALNDLTYPVAIGCAARHARLPLEPTVRMYLHAFISNLASAAQRLMPMGQTAAQGVIRDMAQLCTHQARSALDADPSDLSGIAFLSEIAAMQHETQQPRIFRT